MNNAHMIAPLQQVQSLENKLNEVEASLKDVVIPLLLDNWVEEENIFVQNITVDGLSGDIVPLITLSTVGEIATDDENYSYACISDVVVTKGNIKFIASEKPSISFTVVAKGVSASENNLVADVTALVGRVSELETEIDELYRNKANLDELSFVEATNTTNWTTVNIVTDEQKNAYAKAKFMCLELVNGDGCVVNTLLVPKMSFKNRYNTPTMFVKVSQGDIWAQAFYIDESNISMVMSNNTTLRIRAIW